MAPWAVPTEELTWAMSDDFSIFSNETETGPVRDAEFYAGMAAGALSMLISSLGETLLRLSALRAQRRAAEGERELPPWRRPFWIIGIIGILLAAPLDALSFVWAPMSSIIVLYALKQPVLSIMATVILRETVQCLCWLGILIVAIGSWISLLYAPEDTSEDFESPADFFTPEITGYLLISAVALTGLWVFVFKFHTKRQSDAGVSLQDISMPLISAWMLSASKLFNSGWGRIPDGDQLIDIKWIWLVFGVLFLAGGVFVVNVAGLERMSTHIFMPIGFGFTAIITGIQGVLFGEFEGMPMDDFYWWSAGLAGAVAGTALVAVGSSRGGKEEKMEQDQHIGGQTFDQLEKQLSGQLSVGIFEATGPETEVADLHEATGSRGTASREGPAAAAAHLVPPGGTGSQGLKVGAAGEAER